MTRQDSDRRLWHSPPPESTGVQYVVQKAGYD
jgi:hypothetical protein